MAGLSSSFSRPRKTIGATANGKARGFQTPVVSASSETPSVVRANVRFNGILTPYPNFARTQVHSYVGPAAGASLSTPATDFSPLTRRRGGQQSIRSNTARRQLLTNEGAEISAPVPCHTLKARLSLESHKAVKLMAKPANMKSVDRTAGQFRKRYSGLPGEDWIAHLDSLEIHRANKHM